VQNSKGIDIPQSISEQRPRETVVVNAHAGRSVRAGRAHRESRGGAQHGGQYHRAAPCGLKRPSLIGQVMTEKTIACA